MLIGGAVFPIIAGCYYFFPLINGKKLSDRLGKIAFWLMFIGFNVAFLPMHLTGLRGMPRRVFTYPAGLGFDTAKPHFEHWRLHPRRRAIARRHVGFHPSERESSRYSKRNPWMRERWSGSRRCRRKPWGVRSIPEIDGRYPLWDQPNFVRDFDEGRFYLPDAEERKRETLVTSRHRRETASSACGLPGPTFITLCGRHLTLGGFFIFGTFHLWTLALISARARARRRSVVLALDGDGLHSGKAGKGRRPRPEAAALYLRSLLGQLVGDVHHDARDSDRVRLSDLRLLLLLDGSRGFSPRLRTGPRDLLALYGGGVATGFLGADSSRAPVEPRGQGHSVLRRSGCRVFTLANRRRGNSRRTLAYRSRSDAARLRRDRLATGELGGAACGSLA